MDSRLVLERIGSDGRDETELERIDRNLVELLQEVRVVQMGVQVIFAFLLTVPVSARFEELTDFQRGGFFVTLLLAGAAAVLLMAPTAYHRVLFRCGDKEHIVRQANRLTLAGLAAVGLTIVGALIVVAHILYGDVAAMVVGVLAGASSTLLWAVLPVRRRRLLMRRAAERDVAALTTPASGGGAG